MAECRPLQKLESSRGETHHPPHVGDLEPCILDELRQAGRRPPPIVLRIRVVVHDAVSAENQRATRLQQTAALRKISSRVDHMLEDLGGQHHVE